MLNVSVMGGFAYADTPFNGLTVVVTATDAQAANDLAREIAEAGWARRDRFRPRADVTRRGHPAGEGGFPLGVGGAVAAAGAEATWTRGGGAPLPAPTRSPSPTWPTIPAAAAAATPCGSSKPSTPPACATHWSGVIHDPALAAEAHQLGEGARFIARFNRADGDAGDGFPNPSPRPPKCAACCPAACAAGGASTPTTRSTSAPRRHCELDGITVVVLSNRYQCADPVFFEAFGLDIAAARVVVVKSRGHFRGGFDEFFRHQDIIEVDASGLTSPILSRFAWRHMPRPVIPIDDTAIWTPPA